MRSSDAILRDDVLICFIVAVGEQGAALPQASLCQREVWRECKYIIINHDYARIIMINCFAFAHTAGVILW